MTELKRSELYAKLNSNNFFSMLYIKADGNLRKATGRLHVSNPKHTLVPGTGLFIGQSAEAALQYHNNLKYFDCDVNGNPRHGQEFGKGDYRTAKIDRIQEVTVAGETYKLVD